MPPQPPPPPSLLPPVRDSTPVPQSSSAGNSHSEPAAAIAATSNPYPFTPDQYAIALALAKSTPEGNTVDGRSILLSAFPFSTNCLSEYIEVLQSHMRRNPDAPSPASRRLMFDNFDYWRDEYAKLWREKKTLEEKLLLLDKHHQHCHGHGKLDSDHDSSQESEEATENNGNEATGGISRKRRFAEGYDDDYPFLKINEAVSLHPLADNLTKRVGGHGEWRDYSWWTSD